MSTCYLLSHLLTESAQRAPQAPAVRFADETLDYGELDRRSNRVARALRAQGIGQGDRVGLHLKKSPDAIVSLLGILKAGACVVPVGLGTPAARFADIGEQCSMRCLIASRDACATLGPQAFGFRSLESVLVVGDDDHVEVGPAVTVLALAEAEAAQDGEPLAITTVDRDLAYVLFTSGSTGSPKGVMLSHRAVLTFVDWASDRFGIGPEDRLSNHAPWNFDLSTFDIYAALGAGASVTLIPEGLSMFPGRLADLIERSGITVWYSVPSVLTLLVTRGRLEHRDLLALRLVLFAGEVFPIRYLRELMLALPGPRYVNLYGPTETNVCTFHELQRPPEPDDPPLPIGRACANTKTVVLDEQGGLVTKPGQEGLLFVGGSTVMDGYYGRPAETAAAFARNPLAEGREERLYCTGDWVAVDDAGDYRFLGRRDHMVKVGGYRIELGEIETALYAHQGVKEAAAIAVPDELLGNRIRAVVVRSDPALDEQQLRRHCSTVMPKYMVPQELVFRDDLPRTSTDKVDRPRLARESSGEMAPGG